MDDINIGDLIKRVRDPQTGFNVADRRYLLTKYPSCFIGKEAVDWLLKKM